MGRKKDNFEEFNLDVTMGQATPPKELVEPKSLIVESIDTLEESNEIKGCILQAFLWGETYALILDSLEYLKTELLHTDTFILAPIIEYLVVCAYKAVKGDVRGAADYNIEMQDTTKYWISSLVFCVEALARRHNVKPIYPEISKILLKVSNTEIVNLNARGLHIDKTGLVEINTGYTIESLEDDFLKCTLGVPLEPCTDYQSAIKCKKHIAEPLLKQYSGIIEKTVQLTYLRNKVLD